MSRNIPICEQLDEETFFGVLSAAPEYLTGFLGPCETMGVFLDGGVVRMVTVYPSADFPAIAAKHFPYLQGIPSDCSGICVTYSEHDELQSFWRKVNQ